MFGRKGTDVASRRQRRAVAKAKMCGRKGKDVLTSGQSSTIAGSEASRELPKLKRGEIWRVGLLCLHLHLFMQREAWSDCCFISMLIDL